MANWNECILLGFPGDNCDFSQENKEIIRLTRLKIAKSEIEGLLSKHGDTIKRETLTSLLKSLDEEKNLCELKIKISSKICSSIELLTEPSKISSLNTRNLISKKVQYIWWGYDNNRKLKYEDIKFTDWEYCILIRIYKKDNENVLCDFYNDIKIDSFNVEQEIFNNLYEFLNQCS